MATIESKIRRSGGSKIDIGGVEYHFKPADEKQPEAAHVAEVQDKAHIKRFLEISEAYQLADGCVADADEGDDDAGMVIVNGEEKVDLMALGKAKLVTFAKDNGFEVVTTGNAQSIREQIYKLATAAQ